MTDSSPFSLRGPCVDCPFRKDKDYLSDARMLQIINYMKKDDQLFPCHKTVSQHEEADLQELSELIEWELDELGVIDALQRSKHLKERLESSQEYTAAMKARKNEKMCAGWLIYAKKQNILFNNFRMRVAIMCGYLDVNKFINEDLVIDKFEPKSN